MKIPLRVMNNDSQAGLHRETKCSEAEILACKRGDWEAKHRMAQAFMPLISSLAKKRVPDGNAALMNQYIDAAKKGLFLAARKYKPTVGAERFQVYALDFIESAMDRASTGGNWFTRLFGGR